MSQLQIEKRNEAERIKQIWGVDVSFLADIIQVICVLGIGHIRHAYPTRKSLRASMSSQEDMSEYFSA